MKLSRRLLDWSTSRTTPNMTGVEQPPVNDHIAPLPRERTGSRDYTHTDEWDASKTPPSRFQKRKGSIYATPSSRDGHVERNRDAVEEFHKAHSKRWSISSGKSSGTEPLSPTQQQQQQQRRKSSTTGLGNA